MIDDKLVNLRDLKAVCDSVRDISDSMIARPSSPAGPVRTAWRFPAGLVERLAS